MGGRDYYGALNISHSATTAEIRSGYKRAAMKWHPQKNPSAKVEAEQRFWDIAEAYDVLVDPVRRKRYDEHGENGLKFPAAGSAWSPYQYVGDPFALFIEFFADENPLAPALGLDGGGAAPGISAKEAEKPIEVEVQCSLAELQDGGQRRVVFERTRLGPGARPYQESSALTLPVRAGWKQGTRVTFKGEGNHTHTGRQPGDVIVVIAEQPFPADGDGRGQGAGRGAAQECALGEEATA